MTTKQFAKLHSEEYDRTIEWSEAWYRTFTGYIAELLARDDVTSIPLPEVGVLKKDYKYPSYGISVTTGKRELKPGHMTLTCTFSTALLEKVKKLPERPELASARKKRYRAALRSDLPQRQNHEEEEDEEDPAEDTEDIEQVDEDTSIDEVTDDE